MNTILAWVLVTAGTVNSGAIVIQQPALYPTSKDCEFVLKSTRELNLRNDSWSGRCIQTNVLVSK